MRKDFKKNAEKRCRFTATFVRFGIKNNFKGPPTTTLLFCDVKSEDVEINEDHIWLSMTKGFEQIKPDLISGAVVSFEARIKAYIKGYVNHRYGIDERTPDYKLSYPTKFKIVKSNMAE